MPNVFIVLFALQYAGNRQHFLGSEVEKEDVGATTRKIMARDVTNALALQFGFLGHGAKHAFSAPQLKDIMAGLLVKSALVDAS